MRVRAARVAAIPLLLIMLAGGVIALHRDDGPILHTVALAHLPVGLVVDATASRAYIVSIAGHFTPAGWWSYATGHTAGGYVEVIDTQTGQLLHETALTGAPWFYTPMLALDQRRGRLFVVAQDTRGSVVDMLDESGRLLRSLHLPQYPTTGATIVVDASHGRLYVPVAVDTTRRNTKIGVFNTANGAQTGAITAPGEVSALALDHRAGHLIALSNATGRLPIGAAPGGWLNVFDARSGRLVHAIAAPPVGRGSALFLAVDEQTGHAFVPLYTQSVGAISGGIAVVDTRAGRMLRSLPLNGPAIGVTVTAAHAFVAPVGPVLLHTTVTRASGRVTGSTTSPSLSGPGSVVMLDAGSGRLINTAPTGLAPSALIADPPRSHVIALNAGSINALDTAAQSSAGDPGSVSVFDARRGTLLRTIRIGTGLNLMGLDDRAGRLLVISPGGLGRQIDPWGWVPSWLRRHLPFLTFKASPHVVPPTLRVIDVSR